MSGFSRRIYPTVYTHDLHTSPATNNALRSTYNKALNDLSTQVVALTAGFQELSKTVVSAIENIPSGQSGFSDPVYKYTKHLPALKPAESIALPFWYRAPWSEIRNGSKAIPKSDSPILTLFCEDPETGNLLPKTEIQAARNLLRGYFELLWTHNRAPPRWGEAPLDLQIDFIRTMEEEFKFLRYCDRHWKAEQLFMNYYPTWYDNKTKPKEKKKSSKRARTDDGDDNDDTEITNDNGNSGNDDNGNTANRSKRPRVEVDSNPPPPQPGPTTVRKRVCSLTHLTTTLTDNA